MAVRSRAAIPGGTCGFDLPAYHAWQHGQAANRRADLHRWVASLEPLAQAIALLLQMLRDSGKPRMVAASAGQYQQGCPRAARPAAAPAAGRIAGPGARDQRQPPAVSVRLMRMQPDGKLLAERVDAPFELTLCA
jgi:cell division protein ZapD